MPPWEGIQGTKKDMDRGERPWESGCGWRGRTFVEGGEVRVGWRCGALLTRWNRGAPLDTTQGMGDTGSNRGDCTRLYGPASSSLADPISDLLSQVKASDGSVLAARPLTDLGGLVPGREDSSWRICTGYV